jgi:CRISPR/Cas system CSM-associated protein Csm3 (group 7 of RAMP superfamily)
MNAEFSRRDYPLRYLARLTLQAETPFHVGSGREWRESDAGIMTDANGLPTIPGTSIAGVIRHAMDNGPENAFVAGLFGHQPDGSTEKAEGHGSRVVFSFACIHDSNGVPVAGLIPAERLVEDLVLANAIRPTLRDHARHNDKGVVADGGKFDDLVVCAGHRFTLEIELTGTIADQARWDYLLNLFADPAVRFGGKTSRGLGRFSVAALHTRTFDLSAPGDFAAYAAHPSRLDKPVGEGWSAVAPVASASNEIQLKITPKGFWLFGGGLDPDTDIVPVKDRVIVWPEMGSPRENEIFSLPGSALKGALRHRAIFHAYAAKGYFAGDADESPAKNEAEDLVASLFGNAPEAEGNARQRGALLFSDMTAEAVPAPLQNHVSIDRFTGGARDQALYDEAPLFGGIEFTWRIGLSRALSPDEETLLRAVVADLAESRLQLGGGTGRGHGFFTGTAEFPSNSL